MTVFSRRKTRLRFETDTIVRGRPLIIEPEPKKTLDERISPLLDFVRFFGPRSRTKTRTQSADGGSAEREEKMEANNPCCEDPFVDGENSVLTMCLRFLVEAGLRRHLHAPWEIEVTTDTAS